MTEHYGCAARHEFGGVGNEALKPGQLVIEFRSRLRIPIGEVDGSDQDSLNRRFNVASLMIFRISRVPREFQGDLQREGCDSGISCSAVSQARCLLVAK